jgi:hypothetical protein
LFDIPPNSEQHQNTVETVLRYLADSQPPGWEQAYIALLNRTSVLSGPDRKNAFVVINHGILNVVTSNVELVTEEAKPQGQ